jgi:hypothetical protein
MAILSQGKETLVSTVQEAECGRTREQKKSLKPAGIKNCPSICLSTDKDELSRFIPELRVRLETAVLHQANATMPAMQSPPIFIKSREMT